MLAAITLTGTKVYGGLTAEARFAYRLSARGQRGSQAAKKHNANFIFATALAAEQHRAHPGDHSRVVQIVLSVEEFNRLFPTPDVVAADLRYLDPTFAIGDCDRNGRVSTDELVRGVNIALGRLPVGACREFDRARDGRVTVDDLVEGVRNALTN